MSERAAKALLKDVNLDTAKLSRYDSAIDEALNWLNPRAFRYVLKCLIVSYFRDGPCPSLVIDSVVSELAGTGQRSTDRHLWSDPFTPRWAEMNSEEITIVERWVEDLAKRIREKGHLFRAFNDADLIECQKTLGFLKEHNTQK